jgi:hypothetical protein
MRGECGVSSHRNDGENRMLAETAPRAVARFAHTYGPTAHNKGGGGTEGDVLRIAPLAQDSDPHRIVGYYVSPFQGSQCAEVK